MSDTPEQLEDKHRHILGMLLPPGDAWPREPDSQLGRITAALAGGFAAAEGRAQDLVSEARPSTALETLGDWEADHGLPDQCSLDADTIEMRRQAIIIKRTESGHSPARYVRMLDRLGYADAWIEELRPFTAGLSCAGEMVLPEEYAHVFIVHLPETAVHYWRAGAGRAGESIGWFGDDRAECILNQVKAAHTLAVYAYGDGE